MTIKTLNRPSNYMGYCDHCKTTFLTNELSCKIIDSKSYISLKCPKCGKEILSKQGEFVRKIRTERWPKSRWIWRDI